MKYAITKHSKERCKERLGLKKSCTNKKAEMALKYGIHHYDTVGSLKKYMSYLYESHNRKANNIIIYNRDVFVFNGKILITLFHIPTHYYSVCDKLQKKLNEKRGEKEHG